MVAAEIGLLREVDQRVRGPEQGAGAAAIPTLGVALLSARYHGEVRALALGRLAGIAAALSCFGPLVGGVVANEWGWRAVMALPILGLCVLPFLWRTLTGGGTGARLDVLGAVLVASTAAGVVLLLQSPTTGRLVAGAGLLLVLVGVPLVTMWTRRRPDGFLPLEVIGNQTVVRSAVAAAAVPAAWFAQLVGIPVVLVGRGWEPWQVGTLLLPSATFALLVPRYVGPLHARFGAARCLALSGLIATASLVLAAIGTGLPAAWALVPAVILATVGFGIGQPSLSASVGDAVTHDVRGVALGIATLLFLVGGSIGSAAVAGLGDLVGVPGSLGLLAVFPLVGLVVLAPELRRVPEAVGASR